MVERVRNNAGGRYCKTKDVLSFLPGPPGDRPISAQLRGVRACASLEVRPACSVRVNCLPELPFKEQLPSWK